MISLENVKKKFFFLGLFFLPFNSYEGLSFLGEFSRESAFIFFSIGLCLLFLESILRKTIIFPFKDKIYFTFLLFIIYCVISTLINLPSVLFNYFKYTNGIVRFLNQFAVLIMLGIFLFSYFFSVLSKFSTRDLMLKIRKIFLATFIFMWIYSLFEILVVVFQIKFFLPILEIYNYFPFLEVKIDNNFGRISSVTLEPPFLAIYLMTISGWMYSYILTNKGFSKFLPGLGVLLMAILSGSRTMLIVMLIQLLVFLCLIMRMKNYRKYFIYLLGVLSFSLLTSIAVTKGAVLTSIQEKIETLNFSDNLTKSISNKSRFGMQYANLQVFLDHPIFGVGYGQQAFHNRDYYPKWATKNNYEFSLWYLNENEPSFPPGYNLYIRILAELGIIGFILFFSFVVSILLKLNYLYKKSGESDKILIIILIISFIGFFINWLQIDTFRIFGFWICLAVLGCLSLKNKFINGEKI